MNLITVRKRLTRFENSLVRLKLADLSQSGQQPDSETVLRKLQSLERDTKRIKSKAEDAGDFRTALAAVPELLRIFELEAKLTGELQEREPMNVVTVQLDADTADRIARTYLARHPTLEAE